MERLRGILKRVWGYEVLRPLQAEAMGCVLAGRDSLVVLPTGGGKSLCFQAPALALPGMAVVVSPLISLMKDQVDALKSCGVAAACLNSALSYEERRATFGAVRDGQVKILYVAPERLVGENFLETLKQTPISLFAVDEAHCISVWGHDFRPEYRQLRVLKESFPGVAVHAYTATATDRVRSDIAVQLGLSEPQTHIGSFFRPNLIYSVARREKKLAQVRAIIDRYKGESGIIYCITRREVEELSAELKAKKLRVAPYHAGLEDNERRRNQDAFINDKVEIIVATVAFGMGIDKSNVRYVIHTGMPKSLESYQQESGRAGRDGLDAECCLLYSGQDYGLWTRMLDSVEPEDAHRSAKRQLSAMYEYCTSTACRHRTLIEYFGQPFPSASCDACDVCLGGLEQVADSLVIGQKILSCVVRLREVCDAHTTARVLAGVKDAAIVERGHDQLSTWGLLKSEGDARVREWIEQLASQQYLEKKSETKALSVTEKGWLVLKGEVTPRLVQLPTAAVGDGAAGASAPKKTGAARRKTAPPADAAEQDLFDMLRVVRRGLAEGLGVPAYVIFSDAVLREMAQRRPSTKKALRQISGVGQRKADDFGQDFLRVIRDYCAARALQMDAE